MPKQISNVRVRRVDLVSNPAVSGKHAGILFVKSAKRSSNLSVETLTKEVVTTAVKEGIEEAFAKAKGDRKND